MATKSLKWAETEAGRWATAGGGRFRVVPRTGGRWWHLFDGNKFIGAFGSPEMAKDAAQKIAGRGA